MIPTAYAYNISSMADYQALFVITGENEVFAVMVGLIEVAVDIVEVVFDIEIVVRAVLAGREMRPHDPTCGYPVHPLFRIQKNLS